MITITNESWWCHYVALLKRCVSTCHTQLSVISQTCIQAWGAPPHIAYWCWVGCFTILSELSFWRSLDEISGWFHFCLYNECSLFCFDLIIWIFCFNYLRVSRGGLHLWESVKFALLRLSLPPTLLWAWSTYPLIVGQVRVGCFTDVKEWMENEEFPLVDEDLLKSFWKTPK